MYYRYKVLNRFKQPNAHDWLTRELLGQKSHENFIFVFKIDIKKCRDVRKLGCTYCSTYPPKILYKWVIDYTS